MLWKPTANIFLLHWPADGVNEKYLQLVSSSLIGLTFIRLNN